MRRALVLAAFTALAAARPETYREKEDFQYSRSSSDDGTKSGFYGAQRGNMGGNYERAHNMDSLAQHQMGGLVRTVEGELGDGAKQRSGSVFSAANSRGIYGSGRYDLSNLEGRNFQEGTSFGESQSHSSLSSHNAGYGSQTYSSEANSAYDGRSHNSRGYHGYQTTGNLDQALFANNMQSADSLQSVNQYDGNQEGHTTGYQSGYHGQSGYDQAAANSHLSTYGANYRLVGNAPIRVLVRPGGRVTIPVAAQTYDASQGSSSTFDQNSINSEAEVLGNGQSAYKPTNNAKHYESSYSYRKEWEKHNTNPVASGPVVVPTVNPYPSNSELYEETQAQDSQHQQEASLQAQSAQAQNVQSSNQYRGYNVKSATTSSQSRQQAAYNAHAHSAISNAAAAAASDVAGSSGYTHGAYNYGGASANLNAANLNNQVENFGSKPKSYQSSYSYHKSWEHQGDPYVIKPSTNSLYTTADTQASQRLTASSLNEGASSHNSHQYGAHYHQGHQGYSSSNGVDCDENDHVRVARSSYLNQDQVQEYVSQQTQNEDLGQQSQNLEDFSQQSQDLEGFNQHAQNLEDFGQQSQNSDDIGQLSQNQNLGEIGQQSQNLVDFGQQSQNLGDFGQQSQNLEDFGQQSQNLRDFGQQSQNLEDFGQQTHNPGDFGQQSQKLEDFGQQSQNLGDFSQQSQNLEDFGQQSQNLRDFSQQSQNLQKIAQQSQSLQDFGQQAQDAGQLTQTNWENLDHGQQAETQFDRIENLDQQTQNQWDQESQTDLGQQTQNIWSMFENTQKDNGSKATEHQKNSVEHTVGAILNVSNQNQEKTTLDRDGIQISHTQSERADTHTDQQPHSYWSMNQNNQNTYVPTLPLDLGRVHQNTQQYSVAQNVQLNTGYSYNQHNGFPDNTAATAYNPNPWMFEQTYSNNLNNNFQPNAHVNSYTNTQTHINRNDHSIHSTSNIHHIPSESGSTGLMSLWNLIDDIEKQTITTNETGSSYNSQENNKNVNSFSSLDKMHNFSSENQFDIEDLPPVHATAFKSTVTPTKMETTTLKQDKLHSQDVERGDVGPEKLQPQEEEGRGDIGPENSSEDSSNNFYKPLENHEVKKNSSLYKTAQGNETQSLTDENNKIILVDAASVSSLVNKQHNDKIDSERFLSDLTILGLSKKPIDNFEQGNWKLQKDIQITSTPPQSSNHHDHSDFNIFNGELGAKNVEQHNFDKDIENLGQRLENINQHNNNQFEAFQNKNYHQLVDLGQQNQHLKPKQPDSIDQQNLNLDHQDFNIEHGPDEIQQQNVYNQFENLGQESENLNQQSINQFEDFGQQSVKLEQHPELDQQNINLHHQGFNIEHGPDEIQQQNVYNQFENLGQENENLNQQSINQFEDFGQQSVKFEQHPELDQQNINLHHHGFNIEHGPDEIQQQNVYNQFENLGQESENLNQQSINQFEDFGQQSVKLEQNPEHNFGQENVGFHQENLNGFGQQNVGIHQENLNDFGHQEQFQQESLLKLDHSNKDLNQPQKEQQLENWVQQSENFTLQHPPEHEWKPKDNLQQQQAATYMQPSISKEGRESQGTEPVVEPKIVTQKSIVDVQPIEPIPEEVSFWNKLGSKFTTAKSKVKSWFSSS